MPLEQKLALAPDKPQPETDRLPRSGGVFGGLRAHPRQKG
jgi:hypothetical protein